MKSINLTVIISVIMLSVAGLAQADTERLNQNFMSKRPYQAPIENNKTTKTNEQFADKQFEGATLTTEDENSVESKNARNLKQLRINSLSRRPYME